MASIQHMSSTMMAMRYGALVQEMSGLKAENETLRQKISQMEAKEEARLEKQRESARRARNRRPSMAALPASPVPEPVPAVVIEVAPAAAPVPMTPATAARRVKQRRDFNKLGQVITYGTTVYVESLGERFTAIFTQQGFVNQICGALYPSPYAMSEAHASRITTLHPEKTSPGNGWDHIKVLTSHETIGDLYDEHFSLTA